MGRGGQESLPEEVTSVNWDLKKDWTLCLWHGQRASGQREGTAQTRRAVEEEASRKNKGLGSNLKILPWGHQAFFSSARTLPSTDTIFAQLSLRKIFLFCFQICRSLAFPIFNSGIKEVSITEKNLLPNGLLIFQYFLLRIFSRLCDFIAQELILHHKVTSWIWWGTPMSGKGPTCKSTDGLQVEFQPSQPMELSDHPGWPQGSKIPTSGVTKEGACCTLSPTWCPWRRPGVRGLGQQLSLLAW